jgi:hypothetical protein
MCLLAASLGIYRLASKGGRKPAGVALPTGAPDGGR